MKSTKPRRLVKLFQPRFAPLIQSGAKRQTIRPMPKVLPEVGDLLDCRQWSGLPYRSKQIRLGEFEVAEVGRVFISPLSIRVAFPGRVAAMSCRSETARDFAQADGFDCWTDMHDWFTEAHGLPFHGILIKWRPL